MDLSLDQRMGDDDAGDERANERCKRGKNKNDVMLKSKKRVKQESHEEGVGVRVIINGKSGHQCCA